MEQSLFNKAFSRATQLMNNERFNSIVESKANTMSKQSSNGIGNVGSNEFSAFEQIAFGSSVSAEQPSINMDNASRLPSAIRESFMVQPPIEVNTQSPVDSVVPITRTVQNENIMPIQQMANANIDYSLIKTIVEECINRKLNEFSKSMLNESETTIRGFKFSDGNKIQFIDRKGNLYEGELKLKKTKK